ncbi:hypothetical protein [Collimonas fungivorans]|uniref:hypothetical protein n=1 Tax=Collimonas fungivorans TaxID=158899 RepID=UPI003FA3483F
MSLFNPERFRLTVGVDTLTLAARTRGTPWRVRATITYAAQIAASALQLRLQQLLSEHVPRGREVSIVIADRFARYFIVTPPEQVASFSDLQTIATLRFATLFGDRALDWVMQADWAIGRPFLVCALPRALMTTVLTELKTGGWYSGGMKPESVWVWNDCARRMRASGGWFARIGAGHLLLAASAGGHIAAVNLSIGSPPVTMDALKALLLRESLRWDRPLPSTLYVSQDGAGSMENLHGLRVADVSIVVLRPDCLAQEYSA